MFFVLGSFQYNIFCLSLIILSFSKFIMPGEFSFRSIQKLNSDEDFSCNGIKTHSSSHKCAFIQIYIHMYFSIKIFSFLSFFVLSCRFNDTSLSELFFANKDSYLISLQHSVFGGALLFPVLHFFRLSVQLSSV